MANKTPNYGLTKPLPEEFYDIAVHNENMDKIDTELKKKYDPNNKPTAADVGAVNKAGDTMTGSLTIKKDNPQFIMSSVTNGRTAKHTYWDTASALDITNHKDSDNNTTLRLNSEAIDLKDVLTIFRTKDGTQTVSIVLHTGNIADYALKKDGSNAMTGDLVLENEQAYIQSHSYGLVLNSLSQDLDKANRRAIWIQANHIEPDFNKAIRVVDQANNNKDYAILHTGNSNQTALVSTETTPTVNGQINWQYE